MSVDPEVTDVVELSPTWDALATEGGPPSMGRLCGVGDFLAVTDTYYGETETDQVWLLDLRE